MNSSSKTDAKLHLRELDLGKGFVTEDWKTSLNLLYALLMRNAFLQRIFEMRPCNCVQMALCLQADL